ncbi:MAG: UDP-N-acetylmuramate dehydrogenase [Marinifilaceae bacterium]
MEVKENYNIRKYNTFNIDVKCKYFVESDNEQDFLEFVSMYEFEPSEILVLGRGSNFLFTEDFDGTIFYPTMHNIQITHEDNDYVYVRVGAGYEWDDFVAWSVENGYGGVENLSYIPGHVGAAPVQNVGAYGVEAKDTIYKVEAINIIKARKEDINASQCEFGYRDSIFKREWKNQFIITYVHFKLSKRPELKIEYGGVAAKLQELGGEPTLSKVREAIIEIRKEKLPEVSEYPNAGSFFMNPVVDRDVAERLKCTYPHMPCYDINEQQVKLAAGWLIDQVGWKGKSIGRAGIHAKQALVIINLGDATGNEIAHLANEVKKSVFMKFGIFITPEVYVI